MEQNILILMQVFQQQNFEQNKVIYPYFNHLVRKLLELIPICRGQEQQQ